FRRLLPVALLGAAWLAAQPGPVPGAGEKVPRASKDDLNADNFATIHALVRPRDSEWRHLRVAWLTDVVAARKKAAAEDKPLIICYTGGAGYNEPLGVC